MSNEIDECISKGQGLQAKRLLTQLTAAIDEFKKVDSNELSEAQKRKYYALETLVASFNIEEASRRAEKAAEVESQAEEKERRRCKAGPGGGQSRQATGR